MVNPLTTNIGLIVPLTGADVDQWGELDINPNMVSIDGLFAGVQTISASNLPITLTAPAGLTPTPSAGPTQSQNRVLRFTGILTGDVRVTLPLPGSYIIENRTTGNSFVLSFQGVTATEVVGIEQGNTVEIYNDGANVRFVNLNRVGNLEFWSGVTAVPGWVAACTVKPYLRCDGTIYNFSDYPWLGAKMLNQFGGNGVTTFGVQDLGGRVPLAYDQTGVRITTAGCGINGQTMGAAGGTQGITLTEAQLASHYHVAGIHDPGHSHGNNTSAANQSTTGGGNFPCGGGTGSISSATTGVRVNSSNGLDTTYSAGGGQAHFNVQPAQVSGIWVVKT